MRKLTLLAGSVVLSVLAGCASTGPGWGTSSNYPNTNYPNTTYPSSTYPSSNMPVAGMEYGRILNIEYMPVGTQGPGGNNSILGAVVGGVAGAILGNQIGSGSGRTAATVLGGVAGAAVGNSIARNQQGVTTAPGYRITMQSDQGVVRTYEVPATGDLRVGDRVRVENGVIYRG